MTKAVTATGIAYDVERVESLCRKLEWDDDYDVFVNGNYETHTDIDSDTFEAVVKYDEIDDRRDPVTVYLHEGKMVAWHDAERDCGYIA